MEDPSVLQYPGKRNGQVRLFINSTLRACVHALSGISMQTKVVNEGEKGMAYTWNSAQGQWEKVGEVLGRQGGLTTSNDTIDGVQYDYIFDVQVEQNGPYLKLPFNKGDNPYEVRTQ